MSYCRWGKDSDVYVYATEYDGKWYWVCQGCELENNDGDGIRHTAKAMAEHLLAHREAGHKVPEYAIERLHEEKNEPLA